VTSVAPLKIKLGERPRIKGSGFVPGENRRDGRPGDPDA
jgi:hypothetical protein